MADLDWHYKRTDLAGQYMREFTHLGARALALFAERQSGKTEFLHRDLTPEAREQGRVPVYIDVWRHRDEPAKGIADGFKQATLILEKPGDLDRQVTSINVNILGTGAGVQAAPKDKDVDAHESADDIARIGYWIQRLAAATRDQKVLLMIDEAQALAAHRSGATVTAALRAGFQNNPGKFEVVFTGSSRDKLEILFQDSKAPLFKFGDRIDFPVLDEKFVAHVAERFHEASGGLQLNTRAAGEAFETLGRKPGDLIDIVRTMIRLNTPDLSRALMQKLAAERERAERVFKFRQLSPLDKLVLVYVAHGQALFKRESLDHFAQTLGVETVTTSAVRRSIERLRRHELVERRQGRGEYRVSEEPLAVQLRELSPRLPLEAQEEALQPQNPIKTSTDGYR